jgi:hypothetical protein
MSSHKSANKRVSKITTSPSKSIKRFFINTEPNENTEPIMVKRLPTFNPGKNSPVKKLTDSRPFPPRMEMSPPSPEHQKFIDFQKNLNVSSSLGNSKHGIDPSTLTGKNLDFYNTYVNPKRPYTHPHNSPGIKAPPQKKYYPNEEIKESIYYDDMDVEEHPESLHFGGRKKKNRKTRKSKKTRKMKKSKKSKSTTKRR